MSSNNLRSANALLRAPAKPGLADLRSANALLRAPAKPGLAIINRYSALLVSVALHGAAIAWVQAMPGAPRPEPASVNQPTIEITAAAKAPEPMVVALLDDHTVVPPTTVRGPARIAATNRSTSNPAIGSKVEPSTAVTPDSTRRNPVMTMRRPEQPDLDKDVSLDFTDRFLRNTRPLTPNENPTERLQENLRTADGFLENARWVANATPDQVTAMRMSAASMRDELYNRELQPDGNGRKSEHKTFRIKVAADGSAKIHDKANVQRKGLLGGTFDVTDAMMRRQGIDPYSSYKLKVLDETREERVAMGKQYRTQQLAQSRQHMHKNLERLWSMTTDLATRKRGLFELWDDCAETGSEQLVAGGRSAREYVVGFIRSKLPAGGASAFTADELAQLNRQRKSQATFAPYL